MDATRSTTPRTLKKPNTSRRFHQISQSESENDSENVPLSISKRGSSSHTFLPAPDGELHEPVEQSAPVASANKQGAEIDIQQDTARSSESTTKLPTDLVESVL